jgi:hypothetical protein
MIDDIDKGCRTRTLIHTASKFTFWNIFVWLNCSEPRLTALEDIDIDIDI